MKKLTSTCLLLSPLLSYAGTMGNSNVDSTRPYATISAAAEWLKVGHAQTLELLPPFTNYYTGKETYKSSGSLGFGAGIEQRYSDTFNWQVGLAGYFNSTVKSSGHVWQFSLPEFDNFRYEYQIQSKRLMATTKILGNYQNLHPYVSGEIGAGFNRASAYAEESLIVEAVPMIPFENKTKTSFAWGAGTGLEMDVISNLRVGLGYQFSDLGKVSLGRSFSALNKQTLNQSHLYSHAVKLQLTVFL